MYYKCLLLISGFAAIDHKNRLQNLVEKVLSGVFFKKRKIMYESPSSSEPNKKSLKEKKTFKSNKWFSSLIKQF